MDNSWIFIGLLVWIISAFGKCQSIGKVNTPPVMWLDRHWKIPENEDVGSVITRVSSSDNDNDALEFGLEPKFPGDRLPFVINNSTGVVYLNESLKGRGGDNIQLYITVSDGDYSAKSEVWVNVISSSKQPKPANKQPIGFPVFGQLARPLFYPKINSDFVQELTSPKTKLQPVQTTTTTPTSSTTEAATKSYNIDEVPVINDNIGNQLSPVDLPIKSRPELLSTIVPVISVCAIFLTVGIIAILFRKKICVGINVKKRRGD